MHGFGSATKTFMTRTTHNNNNINNNNNNNTVRSEDGQLLPVATDIPRYMGGQDSAHQPIETFIASLCGCEMVTALYVASKMSPKIVIENIEFDGIQLSFTNLLLQISASCFVNLLYFHFSILYNLFS